ncbi:MAG: agmatine deiminase family protein [Bdellovibrionota bacterium]
MIKGSTSFIFVTLFSLSALAIRPDLKTLPIGLAPSEQNIQIRGESPSAPPISGVIHSLGEWEESREAMTLWPNKSWIRALSDNGKVRLLADSNSDQKWWQEWITDAGINESAISYFVVKTDSLWVRDYGPWYIVDSKGQFGIVDNIYNRPRPNDDKVPEFISKALSLPLYKTGLTHTGGNYYSDGSGNAFSSTLVFTENTNLQKDGVLKRMLDFLGIERYATSPLSPNITIEHLDTFGKLVSPDTWVFSQFPANSKHYKSSEDMVALLKTLRSPYGTPYKIFRMKMTKLPQNSGEQYRAYINSFISNGVLYFPSYGDEVDKEVTTIYQQALPSYKIVGVDAEETEWGDSVHCRSRNLINWNTVFIFPYIPQKSLMAGEPILVTARIYPSPGKQIKNASVVWKVNGSDERVIPLTESNLHEFSATLPAQTRGAQLSLYFVAEDTNGVKKTSPIRAPSMTINAVIE